MCLHWTHPQTAHHAVTSLYTSAPTLRSTSLDRYLLVSKYRTILRYHDMKRHDILISSLGYNMNPISL